jgi:hypothetical protein
MHETRPDYVIFEQHASLPKSYIIRHQDDYLLVPDIPGGWRKRRSYLGYTWYLHPLDPSMSKMIAAHLGLGHGGNREGAGRTPLTEGGMQKKTVSLTDADIGYLSELGNGNLSAGIREAVKRHQRQHD